MATGFRGAIFDVDGGLVDSPHEQAWREGLRRADGERVERHTRSDLASSREARDTGLPGQMSGKARLKGDVGSAGVLQGVR